MKNRLAVTGGELVTPEGIVISGTVMCEDGVITYAGPDANPEPGSTIIDAAGKTVLAGFIDTHVHGSGGDDVMVGGRDAILRAGRNMLRFGTTAWLPTTIAARHDEIVEAIDATLAAQEVENSGARILGLHLEGPYINRKFKGAQPDEGIRDPNFDELDDLLKAARGSIKVMTLAPELPGGLELIRLLKKNGIVASLGHSECDYDTALAAIEAGATYATHLFNAMSGIHHRKPGLAACCLNEEGISAELILDGVHVDPRIARIAGRAKGRDRIALITDAIAAQGCGDGLYHLGKFEVNVKGPLCTLSDAVTIAGSVLTMNRAVGNAMRFMGMDLVDASHMASMVPARRCGVGNRKGSLEVGKDADLAVLNSDFSIKATIVAGELLFLA